MTWSVTVMIFAFAWYPRWKVMIFLSSVARSTLDDSRTLLVNGPRPPLPGAPRTAVPEAVESEKRLPPFPISPLTLLNCARIIWAIFTVFPLVKLAEIVPSAWMDTLFNEPAAAPFCVLSVTALGLPNPVISGVPFAAVSFHVMAGLSFAPLAIDGRVTPVAGIL